jgi:hypothetical protein
VKSEKRKIKVIMLRRGSPPPWGRMGGGCKVLPFRGGFRRGSEGVRGWGISHGKHRKHRKRFERILIRSYGL